MIRMPETCYAKSGDTYIAYQVMGCGPFDLVLVRLACNSNQSTAARLENSEIEPTNVGNLDVIFYLY